MTSSADKTLFHLTACADADEAIEATGADEVEGPEESTWDELVEALLDGLERGWVRHVHLHACGEGTSADWWPTDRGKRAMNAYRTRLRNAGGAA